MSRRTEFLTLMLALLKGEIDCASNEYFIGLCEREFQEVNVQGVLHYLLYRITGHTVNGSDGMCWSDNECMNMLKYSIGKLSVTHRRRCVIPKRLRPVVWATRERTVYA